MTRAAPELRAKERGLHQALQIERDVVLAAAQLANRRPDAGAAVTGASIVDDQPPIDHRHEIENLAMLRADEPVDAGGRKRAAQRRRDGNRMHDVAKRAELDDEDSVDGLTASATREPCHERPVECSFASPTMAVRPP